jgi:hypothetical protein
MQVIKHAKLFSTISDEDAADINGGNLSSAANYTTVAKAFGIGGSDIMNTTLLFTIGALKVEQSGGSESGESGEE